MSKLPENVKITPIPYRIDTETINSDEKRLHRELVEIVIGIIGRTFSDHGHPLRAVHAKSHALLRGELTVLADLPAIYGQGLFARPATYPVVMRISTAPGDILPDAVSTPRGLGIKVLGVPGDRIPGSEGDLTQDFVLATGKTFPARSLAQFVSQFRIIAATTDHAERAKVLLSTFFRAAERGIEALGGESSALRGLGGNLNTHPLGESYFSAAPIRYGDYIAKVGVVPMSPELVTLAAHEIKLHGRADALRDETNSFLHDHGAGWDVRVQLCTDINAMPVEDASVEWSEDASPYVTVAKIRVAPQPAWNAERAATVDDKLSFNPWHGLAAHRPLGEIMRARRVAYAASVSMRGSLGGCPIHEPKGMMELW